MTRQRPRLLLLVTEDWYFWSHRLDLARGARDAGMDVVVATRVQEHGARILREGFTLCPIGLLRRSRHPMREAWAILELVRLYRARRPDIVHHVAMKPVLYGSIAARVARVPGIVNAFAGLGRAFIADGSTDRRMRRLIGMGLRWALACPRSLALFQNQEDCERFVRDGLVRAGQACVIRGAGVDTTVYRPLPEPGGAPIVMLASRMLWDKGVGELVEAARLLRQQGVTARFVLAGRVDEDNPAAIPITQLESWHQEGVIEWWGYREDMPDVLASAALVVLPSYREGLPKSLLEAGACGRPIVATDVPGCREVVREGMNGLLVPARDAGSLAQAIAALLKDPERRRRMGALGREVVVREFGMERVVRETLALYEGLLKATGASLAQGGG